ncbi:MAG: response regulator [Alphaproteobacteria bacterium]
MPHKEATFLLIEDDEIDIMHLKRSFTQLKIANQMVVANDGIEALDILLGRNGHEALSKPYIILLDLNMPRMNGLEFMAALRAEPSLTSTVVFVLTTSNDEKDKLQAYEKHVAGYILKTEAGQSFIEALGMLDQYWRVVELSTE